MVFHIKPVQLDLELFEQEANNKLLEAAIRAKGDAAFFGAMPGAEHRLEVLTWALHIAERDISSLPRRTLHVFDSFAGFPPFTEEADRLCPAVASGQWRPGDYHGPTPEALARTLGAIFDPNRIRIFPGWFGETVPRLPADSQLALIHIACGVYGATREALDGLFRRGLVAEGALLLFEAYNCHRASPWFGERRAWSECLKAHAVTYSDSRDFGLTGHMFIIHDYQGAPWRAAQGVGR